MLCSQDDGLGGIVVKNIKCTHGITRAGVGQHQRLVCVFDRRHMRVALRTHLDEISEVKDKHPPENLVDGEILARIDEAGKPLSQLVSDTGYSEDVVTLSLGRLISAGSVSRDLKGSVEVFCLVPPPAPQLRKALVVLPANSIGEARKRVYDAIPSEGILAKDLVKAARLPREQFGKATEALLADGRIRITKDEKREMYFRT